MLSPLFSVECCVGFPSVVEVLFRLTQDPRLAEMKYNEKKREIQKKLHFLIPAAMFKKKL